MRLVMASVLAVVLASAPAASGAAHQGDYRGYVDRFDGKPAREGSQGAGWRAVLEETVAGRVRYRVCLRHLGSGARRCWARRTSRRGVSRVFVALFVNDVGGPGAWRARWFAGGRTVASWRFRVSPEAG